MSDINFLSTNQLVYDITHVEEDKKTNGIVELVKQTNVNKDILLEYIDVPKVLINIMYDYLHDILPIKYEFVNSEFIKNDLTIELQDNFKLNIFSCKFFNIRINYLNNNNNIINCKTVKININYDFNPIDIIQKSCKHNYKSIPITYFFNHYMKKYYNYDHYIDNIEPSYNPPDGIYENFHSLQNDNEVKMTEENFHSLRNDNEVKMIMTEENFYIEYESSSRDYRYYLVIELLDHEKIKQMIIIVKLFVDILSKYYNLR